MMGNKYEVHAWQDRIEGDFKSGFKYHIDYAGDSIIKAIFHTIKSKVNGAGCVKLEWR